MQLVREDYLKLIRPYYDVDLIKIITGVRRSGKSVLMDTIKNELTTRGISGSHIISINLEDLDYSFIVDINDLHSEIKNLIIDDEKYYISVVDIVGVLSESDNPRNYWKVLKHRLKKEGK